MGSSKPLLSAPLFDLPGVHTRAYKKKTNNNNGWDQFVYSVQHRVQHSANARVEVAQVHKQDISSTVNKKSARRKVVDVDSVHRDVLHPSQNCTSLSGVPPIFVIPRKTPVWSIRSVLRCEQHFFVTSTWQFFFMRKVKSKMVTICLRSCSIRILVSL
jgi:hypothetical protein